jgi:hypothetical protein
MAKFSKVRANKIVAYGETDLRGKEHKSNFGAFYGAGIIGGGSPTGPYKWQWTQNGEIITEYQFDITDLLCKGDAANDVIGLAAGAAYLDRVVTATHGLIYRAEMTCLEAPVETTATITADIDITYDTLATLVYDGAGDGAALASGGSWTLGRTVVTEDCGTGFAANNYLYIGEGDNAAATGKYGGGKFVLKLYGRPAFS